jgi:hypothetical protein
MRTKAWTLGIALIMTLGGCSGGAPPVVDDPYQSCNPGDGCTQGTACVATTLPASAGYTGYLCTVQCNTDADCPQDLTNFVSTCVNDQCYTQCPNGGANCPYGTGCLSFADQAGNPINLCTP